MITAKEIRKKCEEDIIKLQQVCQHPENIWCEESWAPGHLTGRQLKICTICEKVLKNKGSTLFEKSQRKFGKTESTQL